MALATYDRDAAVAYARKWALSRNPKYYDYEKLGGDCTNFVSQCLYAGGGVMNYKPTFGWYYFSANNHSPSWTGVPYLYNFLVRKSGVGHVGKEVSMDEVQARDISQFAGTSSRFSHTQSYRWTRERGWTVSVSPHIRLTVLTALSLQTSS